MDYAAIADEIVKEANATVTYDPKYSIEVRTEQDKSPWSNWGTRQIYTLPVVDALTLTVLAHEAGHIMTTPKLRRRRGIPASVIEVEYAATKWAIDAIERHGVEPDKAAMAKALRTYMTHSLEGRLAMLFLGGTPKFKEIDHFMRSNLPTTSL